MFILQEREARREFLLQRSRKTRTDKDEFIPLNEERDGENTGISSHINFFKELEDGTAELKQSNKEHDKEQKEEREKYEKQIGYLTYLGQDTNEALGKKSWYDVAPDRSNSVKSEINLKSKIREDPMEIIRKYTSAGKLIDEAKKNNNKMALYKPILNNSFLLPNKKRKRRDSSSSSDRDYKHKHKKSKDKKKSHKRHKLEKTNYSKSESDASAESDEAKVEKKQKLEVLRLERLKREREERRRTEELLAKLRGEKKQTARETLFKKKYNSQFNPEFAKQNYDKNR